MSSTILQYGLSMSAYVVLLFLIVEKFRAHYKAAHITWLLS